MLVGIADLERGVESIEAGAPAPLPTLYELHAREHAAAHSSYNPLVRRLVSYESAAECAR